MNTFFPFMLILNISHIIQENKNYSVHWKHKAVERISGIRGWEREGVCSTGAWTSQEVPFSLKTCRAPSQSAACGSQGAVTHISHVTTTKQQVTCKGSGCCEAPVSSPSPHFFQSHSEEGWPLMETPLIDQLLT